MYHLQHVGKDKIGAIPKEIAKFLNLPKPEEYTGHCFRRTAATILVENGGDLITLQLAGKWESAGVAKGYVDDSRLNQIKVSNIISKSVQLDRPTSDSTSTNFNPMAPSTSKCYISSVNRKQFTHTEIEEVAEITQEEYNEVLSSP